MEPLVTIVTVAFNSEKTIEKTIKSVLNQTYPKIEYLIIDGKSGDQTVEIAKTYEEQALKKGYSYRIVSEKDRGIYDAMNKGIALAKGEIMGFINSDDWYEKDAVALSVKTMLKKQCDITFGDIAIHKADGSRIVKRAKLSRYETSRHWNHPTMFVKTSVYRDFPFRQKGIHDDYGAYLAMKRREKRWRLSTGFLPISVWEEPATKEALSCLSNGLRTGMAVTGITAMADGIFWNVF